VGAELFHANRLTDGQTDITKLLVTFRNSANAPKKYVHARCFVQCYGASYVTNVLILWS
jgi:hypothetical protein